MGTSTQPLTQWEIDLADQLLVDVDLTKDVPCAWPECDQPAVWMLTNLCCQLRNAHCQPHRERSDEFHQELDKARFDYRCTACHATNPPYEWRAL
jgi:hypothetical protein